MELPRQGPKEIPKTRTPTNSQSVPLTKHSNLEGSGRPDPMKTDRTSGFGTRPREAASRMVTLGKPSTQFAKASAIVADARERLGRPTRGKPVIGNVPLSPEAVVFGSKLAEVIKSYLPHHMATQRQRLFDNKNIYYAQLAGKRLMTSSDLDSWLRCIKEEGGRPVSAETTIELRVCSRRRGSHFLPPSSWSWPGPALTRSGYGTADSPTRSPACSRSSPC